MNKDKASRRQELIRIYQQLWPEEQRLPVSAPRPPLFPQAGQAAENLRRLPAYRQARHLLVTAEPGLLQVRINALLDGKTVLAATPGLKQGLVRLSPETITRKRLAQDMQGHALFKSGRPLRLGQDRIGKVDMLVSTALAADRQGWILGDGRGLLDLLSGLLTSLKLWERAPLLLLLHPSQIVEGEAANWPREAWDARAQLAITPQARISLGSREKAAWPERAPLQEKWFTPAQRKLPLLKAWLGLDIS
jgi:5-formyltetrahydrofolate cyclo-ligase